MADPRTGGQIARAVAGGQASATEIAERTLDAVESTGRRMQAVTAIDREKTLASAARVDRAEGAGPLAGVPIAIKDNIAVAGWPLECASRILRGFRASESATVWARLEAAGAVPAARANMDEFGMGSSSEHTFHGAVRNPWNPARVAGGSSGGCAALVAAGVVPLAIGSDTGGSVRQPAAFCGLFGFKPSYGALSRYGLVAYGSSLDQIGAVARSIADLQTFYSVAAGPDGRDATARRFDARPLPSLAGARVGVMTEVEREDLSPAIRAAMAAARQQLEAAGARVVSVSVPTLPLSIAIYYIVAPAEASANLARFDGLRYGARESARGLLETYARSRSRGFGPEVRRRILIGTFVLAAGYADAYYRRAQLARRALAADFDRVFEQVDALLLPTAPSGAFPIGAKVDDPVAMYLSDVFTVPANLAGLPALAMPAGVDADGMPISLQLMGPRGADEQILALGAALAPEPVEPAAA